MDFVFEIEGGNFSKAGIASSEIKKILKQLNVNPKLIKRIVVALYEAEVNVVAHAFEGEIEVNIFPKKIQITIKDKGPGIPDVEMAMKEGFSTASKEVREMGFGAGMGLPNIKKNTDEMYIRTKVGDGTELELINYI